jgi:uncharacterized protein YggE
MKSSFIVCLTICFSGGVALAQSSAPEARPHVEGRGEAVIERAPDTLRLSMQLTAKSMQFKQCLSQLKERSEAARTQLVALGATKDSIKIGPPHIDDTQATFRKQMEVVMAQQMRQRGKKKKTEIVFPTVIAAQLTAEWPLAGKPVDEILSLAHDLANKIKAADLSGTKKSEKLLPEEEEVMEESEGASNFQRYSQSNEKPGEPMFLYVCTIPADAQDKGFAEAFQKAKENAARLAKSANAIAGRLLSLRKDDTLNPYDSENYRGYGGEYAQYMAIARMSAGSRGSDTEAVGPTPDKIEHRIRVAATFELRAN